MDLIKTILIVLGVICMLTIVSCSISCSISSASTESFVDTKRITLSGNLDKKDHADNNKLHSMNNRGYITN